MREIRRRTRVVGAFPDGRSALMLVAARLRYVAVTRWGKRYLQMSHLAEVVTISASFYREEQGRGVQTPPLAPAPPSPPGTAAGSDLQPLTDTTNDVRKYESAKTD